MFAWSNDWTALSDEKHRLYLEGELTWELAENPKHILFGRRFTAIGWIAGYDDLLLQLDPPDSFAWVHLSWNRENQPAWPHCQVLDGIESVNRFIADWQP